MRPHNPGFGYIDYNEVHKANNVPSQLMKKVSLYMTPI